jgi:hypothetical protein
VLPLHECAAEFVANPATIESIANPAAAEPLHSVADPTVAGAAPTETSCLCVQVRVLS